MKKIFFALFSAATIVTSCFNGSYAQSPDGIVAVVGREIILKSDVDEQELMFKMQYPEAKRDPQVRKRLVENMIDQKILLTKAKIDSVSVDEKAIDEMATAKYNTLRAGFPSVGDMELRFSRPLNRLKQDIREDIRNQQMVESIRRKRFRDVTVTNEEVMDFYARQKDLLQPVPEEVSVSQLIKYPDFSLSARNEALEKINAVQAKLKAGADFASLAREYSDDPGSNSLGGDLGFVQKGELVSSFEAAAYALKPGQVSDVVESRFGYHLIQLLEKEGTSIHVRHILAIFDRSRTDESKTVELLRSLRADVLAGKTTFAAIAEKYSDDPVSSKMGGAIKAASGSQFIELSSLRPELQKIIGQIHTIGGISQPEKIVPAKSEPFFALFQLNAREAAHRMTPERDYTRIEELATDSKRQEMFKAWIDSLKKEVMVQVMSDI
ncbi:MAG: peptidylprolyl isomerase [Chlorobiaceae bacterium]|nr:peptidylprolyl isomerase [Chlorobiaceae bacterium]